MKIVHHISMIWLLLKKLILRGMFVICAYSRPKYTCFIKNQFVFSLLKQPVTPGAPVRYDICLPFKYASDFIWMLGKNNLDTPSVCRLLPTPADTDCCNCVLQPTEAVQICC
jgi:hypothetical protein